MLKPARGSKRVCQSCGARFYDLSRNPIVCPVCQTAYQVIPPPTRRGERTAPPEAREKEVAKVAPIVIPETINLEEAEEDADDVSVEEDAVVDLGTDEADIPAADDDNTFLEEPEADEEADVSGIVSGPEKDEG